MKSVYKKVSVIALSSMIIAGGIASSGINAQAYSSNLKHQIEDIGKGAGVYYEAKYIVEKAGGKIEAVFSSEANMNRYVSEKYWHRINGQSPSAKKLKQALLKGKECGKNAMYLEEIVKKHDLGNMFRVRYKGYYLLIRVASYKDMHSIPEVSEDDLKRDLSDVNRGFYKRVLKDIVKQYGGKVVKISDSSNDEDMKDYIKDRFAEGIFEGNEDFKEDLEVGLSCGDGALYSNLRDGKSKGVMRLNYYDIKMVIVYDK